MVQRTRGDGYMQSQVFFKSCVTKLLDFSNALDLGEQTFIIVVYSDRSVTIEAEEAVHDPRMQIILVSAEVYVKAFQRQFSCCDLGITVHEFPSGGVFLPLFAKLCAVLKRNLGMVDADENFMSAVLELENFMRSTSEGAYPYTKHSQQVCESILRWYMPVILY